LIYADLRVFKKISQNKKIISFVSPWKHLDLLRRLRWKIMIICTFRQSNDIIYKWTVKNFCFSPRWKQKRPWKKYDGKLNDVTFRPTRQMTKNDYNFLVRSTSYLRLITFFIHFIMDSFRSEKQVRIFSLILVRH